MSDASNKWDNVVLDEDGVTNAQYSALAAGENLMELPPEILAQPALLDSYIFGVNQTINQIAISLHECMTEGDGENAVHWREQEQIAQTRLQTAQALTQETFLAMQQELEGLELSIAKGEEHPNVDSRIAELERLMEQSPWTLIPGEGCVPRQQADQLMQSQINTAPLTQETFLAMEQELEGLELSVSELELYCDMTKPELEYNINGVSLSLTKGRSRIAELERLMEQSPWMLLHGDEGVPRPRQEVAQWIGKTASIEELLEKGSIAEYAKHYKGERPVLIGDYGALLASWAEEHVRNYLRQNTSDEDNIYDVVALLKEHDEDQYASLEEDYCEEFGNPVACRP